jgi:hypothetical protein
MSNEDLIREMCVEYEKGSHRSNEEAMRAALAVLADGVTHDMTQAYVKSYEASVRDARIREAIAAAIREAGK